MEQRKLMLPAFHGERMERLTGLIDRGRRARGRDLGRRARARAAPADAAADARDHPARRLRARPGRAPRRAARAARATCSRSATSRSRCSARRRSGWSRLLDRVGPLAGFVDLRDGVDALLFELIDERRAEHGERDDVLSMLLEARHEDGSPMSEQELRDELMTLLVAGHETTATTLAWAFERLVREPGRARAGWSPRSTPATATSTSPRRSRRRCAAGRCCRTPRRGWSKKPIEVGGWNYEPGVCLVAERLPRPPRPATSIRTPTRSGPERFLDEPPGTYTWIPFGGGRRRCLGASFAMLEMGSCSPRCSRPTRLGPAGAPSWPAGATSRSAPPTARRDQRQGARAGADPA